MFEDITALLLWILLTYVVVTIIDGFIGAFYYSEIDARRNRLIQHLDRIIHRVRIEKDREIYYWYDDDNGEFLAQGSTNDEIVNNLKHRFPTHIFYFPTRHLISEKTNWKPTTLPIDR